MKKLDDKDLDKEWAALALAATRRLVRVEAKNVVALRTVVRRVHHELLGHLATHGSTTGRRGALAALKHATTRMQQAVAEEIARMRGRARDAALEQAQAELNRLAADLREAGTHFRPPPLERTGREEDEAHADAVARSFASRWAHAVLVLVVKAREDEDPQVDVKAKLVAQRLDKRVGVIASTETASAYNSQHDDAVEDALDEDDAVPGEPKRRWLPLVVKRWSAVLDRKTCAECRDRDGETVPLGAEFSDHVDGPPLHASCRCVSHLFLLPIPWSADEEPDEDAEEVA